MEKEAKVLECEFTFKCPQQWDRMLDTGIKDVHLCLECHKPVYFAETKEQLEDLKRRGECVAVWQENPKPNFPPIQTAGMVISLDEEPPISPRREPNPNAQYCPRCSSETPLGNKFCKQCGSILR